MLETILAEIDSQIAKLQQARALLTSAAAPLKRGPGRPVNVSAVSAPKKRPRRKLSAEAKEKIRQAQLKRWAATKKKAK